MIDFIISAAGFVIGWFFGYKYSLKIADIIDKDVVIFGKKVYTYQFFTNFKYLIAGLMFVSIFVCEEKDLQFVILFSVGIALATFIVAVQIGIIIKTISQGLDDE